jgi:hypothetical protein
LKKSEIVKPSIPSYKRDGCKFEEYDKELKGMINCGKEVFDKALCREHYDYVISIRGKA